jgi:UDP-3-O-[3-hydroxymyristoyl] glucosamine N-acyltransferase
MSPTGLPAEVGARVTVGHLAMIHACVIGDECLIGMHATILDGAVIGSAFDRGRQLPRHQGHADSAQVASSWARPPRSCAR